jgi:hypothetical protein
MCPRVRENQLKVFHRPSRIGKARRRVCALSEPPQARLSLVHTCSAVTEVIQVCSGHQSDVPGSHAPRLQTSRPILPPICVSRSLAASRAV